MSLPRSSSPALIAAVAVSLGAAAPAAAQCCRTSSQKDRTQSIVDTAASAGKFKTLLAAARQAGLVDALSGEGPLTVFAPTDAAFAALPAGTVEGLLRPESRARLSAILTYHVASGRLDAAAVARQGAIGTLNGQRLPVDTARGVRVGGAEVIAADLQCTNGVIHVIDRVLLPSSDDLLATAAKAGSFTTLAAAVQAAGLAAALTGDGPLTVFAPTDEAFAKLPAGTVESLLRPENRAQLVAVLELHVVAGRVYSDQALEAGQATTLAGSSLPITSGPDGAAVGGARLVATDVQASNGVIHVIDSVLLPNDLESAAAPRATSRPVTEFDGADRLRWQIVNDTVMGGRSQSRFERTERDTFLFSGRTSLENNGGFASVRSVRAPLAVAGADGLEVRVKGDGRAYRLTLRTANSPDWVAYWADLPTRAGEWITVRIPFEAWAPTAFGRRLPGPALNRRAIDSVGFMLYDQQAGPFALEVDRIAAYRGEAAVPDQPSATPDTPPQRWFF